MNVQGGFLGTGGSSGRETLELWELYYSVRAAKTKYYRLVA